MSAVELKLHAPKRQIAAYTEVEVTEDGRHIEITQHGEHRVELTIEAAQLLLEWMDRAGVGKNIDALWPGIDPDLISPGRDGK